MRIILKFLIRNIKEKKLRTLLILLSITLSTALLFATLATTTTAENMLVQQYRRDIGSSDIVIQVDDQINPDPFFEMEAVEDARVDYAIGMIRGIGIYDRDEEEQLPILLMGYKDASELNQMFDISTKEEIVLSGNNAIIAKAAADANDLSINDSFVIYIEGETHTFKVSAIADTKGLFNYDGSRMTVVVSRDTLETIYEKENLVTHVYVKTQSDKDVKSVMADLSEDYSDLIVKTTISPEQLQQNIASYTSTFSIMLVLVILISVFIIYTSFKVITYERLPIVGTFRSIGATKKTTDWVLLGESMVYGVIGGVVGCGLGFIILKLMIQSLAYNPYTKITSEIPLVFSFGQLLITFLFAVILSMLSALFPIIKVSKIPVRNIVLNQIREIPKKENLRTIIGVTLFLLGIIMIKLPFIEVSLPIGAISFLLTAVGIIFLIPGVTELFVYLFEKVINIVFGNEGVLAVKNMRKNKNVINNITLLTIGIAGIFMINTVSQNIVKETINAYSDAKFEISLFHPNIDDELIETLDDTPGIESTCSYYQLTNIKLKEKNDYVTFVFGVDGENYFDFWQLDMVGDKDQIIQEFENDRSIITSNVIKRKFGLQLGDELTLVINEQEIQYKIVGFVDALMYNGDFIYLPETYLSEDLGITKRSEVMIKTSLDDDTVIENIKNQLPNQYFNITTMKEMEDNNIEQNNQMISILKSFSILTMVIGIFGVFNNFVVSLISRKRSIAMYRSIGMDRRQVIKMLFIESLTTGAIGGIVGVIAGVIFVMNAEYLIHALIMPIPMHISWVQMISVFIGGIVVSVFASIVPTLKTSKLSIINSIKYE